MTRLADPAEEWPPYAAGAAGAADLDTRVHVWRIDLGEGAAGLAETLSDPERARADRFLRSADRRRFVAVRGILRLILADMLYPEETGRARTLDLREGPNGKPFLAAAPGLHFNVSHSEDVALIAVSRTGPVGVDVERQRRMDDMEGVARLIFTEAEQAALLGCPAETRETVFYRIWTRKEALLKAMGTGIAGLKDLEPGALVRAGHVWQVTTLPHLDGYAAAVARPRGSRGLRLWSWCGPSAPRGLAPASVAERPPFERSMGAAR